MTRLSQPAYRKQRGRYEQHANTTTGRHSNSHNCCAEHSVHSVSDLCGDYLHMNEPYMFDLPSPTFIEIQPRGDCSPAIRIFWNGETKAVDAEYQGSVSDAAKALFEALKPFLQGWIDSEVARQSNDNAEGA